MTTGFYSNRAARHLPPPQADYDFYISFQDYFYKDIPAAMPGLFDRVDAGPRTIVEPRMGCTIEVDVAESRWGDNRAYIVKLHEVAAPASEGAGNSEDAAEGELHWRRMAFNGVMFSGEGNNLAYWQRGYQGIRVWDSTANRMVSSSGSDYLQ